jgi:ribosomal protein S4
LKIEHTKKLPFRILRFNAFPLRRLRLNAGTSFLFQSIREQSTPFIRHGLKKSRKLQPTSFPLQKKRVFLKQRQLGTRFEILETAPSTFKSRFLSSAQQNIGKVRNNTLRTRCLGNNLLINSGSLELLRNALLKRFVTRRIRDLRKAAFRRKNKARSRPFWTIRKHDKKIWKAARYKAYNIPGTYGYTRAITRGWAFSEFSIRVSRRKKRQLQQETAFGEVLSSGTYKYKRLEALRYRTSRFRRGLRKQFSHQLSGRRLEHCMFTKRKNRKLKKTKVVLSRTAWQRRNKASVEPLYKTLSYKVLRAGLNNTSEVLHLLPGSSVSAKQPKMLLTPLHFRKNTTQIFVSAEEKERRRLYVQTTRQRRYRRLTETSEALTTMYTHLISYLIGKKTLKRALSRSDVSNLVTSIYWNLRLYLSYNFYNNKSAARDTFARSLGVLKKETSTAAKERFFSLRELTTARYQYQPHSLHAAPLLKRGAEAWLRQFLPVFYELYTEDADNYSHLNLTPIKVFRSCVNREAVQNWETQQIPGLMENRFARLTTERFENNSPRFENMLMTTRRTPAFGGYGAAANLRIVNPAGSYVLRHSFFKREFTTTSKVQSKSSRKTDNAALFLRLQLLRRHVTTEKCSLPAATVLKTYRFLKGLGVARGKSRELLASDDTGAGSIDIRLDRTKSPRSGEYLQRLLRSDSSVKQFSPLSLVSKIKQKAPVSGAVGLYRGPRSKICEVLHTSIKTPSSTEQSSIALATRAAISARRSPLLLQALQNTKRTRLALPGYRAIYGTQKQNLNKRMAYSRLLLNESKEVERKAFTTLQTAVTGALVAGQRSVTARRSLLHFRSAALRMRSLRFNQRLILARQVPQLHFGLWKNLRKHKFSEKLSARIKTSGLVEGLNVKGSTKLSTPRQRSKSSVQITQRFCFPGNRLSPLNTKIQIYRMPAAPYQVKFKGLVARPALSFFNQLSAKRKAIKFPCVLSKQPHRVSSYFVTNVKFAYANKTNLSKVLVAIEKLSALTPLNTNRPRLWGKLTLRWMKKRRIMKAWLREVKYGFKQRVWRSRRNIQALPEELFKLARIRLRKLDWRESDEKFHRWGLNQAFTFHPRERRNAPWLESLLYRRSLYSYCRGEYRRAQFPREYKVNKWIQKLRKLLYRRKLANTYVKRRRWPTLRLYNQRLGRSLFNIRTSKAVLKRFRQRARRNTKASGLEHTLTGFGDRFDVNLMLLGIAPTVFWAREIAPMGLLRVNGRIIREASFRFKPGDYVEWVWDKLQKLKVHFSSLLKKRATSKILKKSSFSFPGNFEYCSKLRSARYLRLPRPGDLVASGRLNEYLFLHFRLDSGLGK